MNESRTNFSFYLDSEFYFSEKWMLATALRYEHYSDFGSTLNSKLATRFKILPYANIRSSFSTGFRAPSLAQIYYNLKFTNYIGNEPVESFLIANNDPITEQFGIHQLKEEKAFNYSLGLALNLNKNLNITIDSYHIAIKDRIILSGNFDATTLNLDIQNVQFVENGVNTSTYGIEFKTNWDKQLNKSKLSIGFNGNINTSFFKLKRLLRSFLLYSP